MYIQYRNLQLIENSARTDEDNKRILNGDYLDKSQENFIMPSKDEMMKFIFSDWQVGDILVIADYSLKHPKKQGDTLVEMTREEICESGDLSILIDGEIYENGVIKTIPRPQGIKIEWQYPNWVETATLEEQLEYYKQEILKNTKEMLVYKEVGFTNDELQTKIDELTQKHNEIAFELGTQENKTY